MKMPDESCRMCGGMLEPFAQCFQCKEPIQRICTICSTTTPEQFHGNCFYGIIEKYQTEKPLEIRREQN